MKRLAVNPNRMELIKLKRRLELARRGHKLLKDKFEGLRERFLERIKKARRRREALEKNWLELYADQLVLRAQLRPGVLEQLWPAGGAGLKIARQTRLELGLKLTGFRWEQRPEPAAGSSYEIPAEAEELRRKRARLLEDLLGLAQEEKALWLMAAEIERTRRRVNALEYVLIPALAETIDGIELKLDQLERFNIVALMKMKDIVASYQKT